MKGFREFIMRGNVVELAVAVIIGAAFTSIVNSLVDGIFNPIIAALTRPGDMVLDPFAGSGSTLVAAQLLGRGYVGIELDAGHVRTARRRLAG